MKRSIFSVTIGSNDFLNNYLLPVLWIGARVSQTPDSFVDDLLNHLKSQLPENKGSVKTLILSTRDWTYGWILLVLWIRVLKKNLWKKARIMLTRKVNAKKKIQPVTCSRSPPAHHIHSLLLPFIYHEIPIFSLFSLSLSKFMYCYRLFSFYVLPLKFPFL
ncbi:hypothetical protein L2E82_10511 [Cichorium intybus]|uniref:Uncharacterized protein n=1 Tax=Cichorium intybus TaxID=13427 RepID=A0ACB9GAR2_CICIN|nr:hypothetical protein L2E82_10511 [Cichorium intybus]